MSVFKTKSFTAVLEPLQTGLGWVIARIPFDVTKAWPVRNRLRVRGKILSERSEGGSINIKDAIAAPKRLSAEIMNEGFAFRSSLLADGRGGSHFLLVNKKMQAAAKAGLGAKVRIRLEPDLEERSAVVPAELAQALKGDRRLRKWFDELNYTTRKAIGDWVNEPKSAESRAERAERIAERLLLTLEGEQELPPILQAAFHRQPLARTGWEAMTVAQRRSHLLGIFYYRSIEAREVRAEKAVKDALRVARRKSGRMMVEE
jgi:uncharacterized protein YdeI (YjbR/CyaY-like superfamily)